MSNDQSRTIFTHLSQRALNVAFRLCVEGWCCL